MKMGGGLTGTQPHLCIYVYVYTVIQVFTLMYVDMYMYVSPHLGAVLSMGGNPHK